MSASRVLQWEAPGRLRVWRVSWGADGFEWSDPAGDYAPETLGIEDSGDESVLGVVLRLLDQRGDSPLPALLRVLADQVDELMADLEQSAKPPVHFYDRADGRTVCDWDNHSNTTQCGRAYSDHPTETYGDLVLHRLCDGRLVKL